MGRMVDIEKEITIPSVPQSQLKNVNTKMWYPIDLINNIFGKSTPPAAEPHFHPVA